MNRINFILFMVVVLMALAVVNAQHRSRVLFIDLQKERDYALQLHNEWNELQIQQGSLTSSKRIEEGAIQELQMHSPLPGKIKLIVSSASSDQGVP
ncbi:cell division protein FtsL [Ferrovum sp. JA12]|uniref:cell division protein FtsL n=1 Tax=Ferrovum sp. JA12 TaxID=1356299 RepID=UPI000702C4C7|nr:cell division protein FtsL [Ferrovum sp. JA12]KRH79786.1 cell division protein FtsL [Ferrovum sp. JA12]HQT80693.1 cell division protein FtsL [Ferrovaceae bacterium]HQU05903.1 cell division protein FtsL [Ferrovaceae bacterium]